jgi:hypothetical protein
MCFRSHSICAEQPIFANNLRLYKSSPRLTLTAPAPRGSPNTDQPFLSRPRPCQHYARCLRRSTHRQHELTEPEPPTVNITLTPERIGALAQSVEISQCADRFDGQPSDPISE